MASLRQARNARSPLGGTPEVNAARRLVLPCHTHVIRPVYETRLRPAWSPGPLGGSYGPVT